MNCRADPHGAPGQKADVLASIAEYAGNVTAMIVGAECRASTAKAQWEECDEYLSDLEG
jgi:hypothetical protein